MATANNISVSRREENKNVFDKFLALTSFALSDFGIAIEHKEEVSELKEGDKTAKYTRFIYETPELQFVADCVAQRVENYARSKDKANGEIATTVAELLESGGGSKYPVVLKAFKESLLSWMDAATKLTSAHQASIIKYTDAKALGIAKQSLKDQVSKVFTKFVDSLSDEKQGEFAMVINKLSDALETQEDTLDFAADEL